MWRVNDAKNRDDRVTAPPTRQSIRALGARKSVSPSENINVRVRPTVFHSPDCSRASTTAGSGPKRGINRVGSIGPKILNAWRWVAPHHRVGECANPVTMVHGHVVLQLAGPREPAGYSSSGTRLSRKASSTGVTIRQHCSATSPRTDRTGSPSISEAITSP